MGSASWRNENMIDKPERFRKERASVSVILPIYAGRRSPHLARLLDELQKQTFHDFEVIVAEGIEPNGRARNEAVKQAFGDYFVFIDETTSLGHEKILENLLRPFFERAPQVGMTGASIQPARPLKNFQRQYVMMRTFESPIVHQLTESWQVQHPCMAISRKVFEEADWESDCLITGTDDDLRQRVHAAGYRMFLVPNTWCIYLPPDSVNEILRKGFRKGKGSAYALLIFPGLFPFARIFGRTIQNPFAALFYKMVSAAVKIFHPKFILNPLALLYEGTVAAGFFSGWLRWIGKTPLRQRLDLPGVRRKMGLREFLCPA